MSATLEIVKEQLTHFNRQERAEISRHIEELDQADPAPHPHKAEWDAVIRRRIQEIEDGTAVCIPGDVALAAIRKRLNEKV